MESGYEAFSYILGQKVTAIFSMNDEMAFGIYRAARLYGVSIPEDISIIGFDTDLELSAKQSIKVFLLPGENKNVTYKSVL